MPNIAILNYCNLKCPYCFADDMIQQKKKIMSLDSFREILDYLAQSHSHERIGIIGGEPTLHPEFIKIINEVNQYCLREDVDATIFSNGIELEKYLPMLGSRTSILLNCNAPENQTEEQYAKMVKCLDTAYQLNLLKYEAKIVLGCNIYLERTDYSYLWNLVDRYSLDVVRCSVCAPGGCYTKEWRHQDKKEEYYQRLKPVFMSFVRDAVRHRVKLILDCNQIPSCMLTEDEQLLINSITAEPRYPFCEPVVDINPDLKATTCFGTYDIDIGKDVFIKDFANMDELRRYLLLEKQLPRIKNNGTGACAECELYKLYRCQGGCLSFGDPD